MPTVETDASGRSRCAEHNVTRPSHNRSQHLARWITVTMRHAGAGMATLHDGLWIDRSACADE
jgi:hypothetical protein